MKDAKGHGSESRGGVFTKEAARGFAKRIGAGASHQVGVNSVPTNPATAKIQIVELPQSTGQTLYGVVVNGYADHGYTSRQAAQERGVAIARHQGLKISKADMIRA
jgi:hypothetical protein